MLKINSNLLKCGSVLPRHTNSLNSALQWHTALWLWLKCFSTCAPKLDYPDKYNFFPYSLAFLLPQQLCAPDIATSTDFTAYQEKKKRYISQVLHICNGSPRLRVVLEIPSLPPSDPQPPLPKALESTTEVCTKWSFNPAVEKGRAFLTPLIPL